MGKVEYTESHIRFILDNWNPKPSASGYLLHYIKKEFDQIE